MVTGTEIHMSKKLIPAKFWKILAGLGSGYRIFLWNCWVHGSQYTSWSCLSDWPWRQESRMEWGLLWLCFGAVGQQYYLWGIFRTWEIIGGQDGMWGSWEQDRRIRFGKGGCGQVQVEGICGTLNQKSDLWVGWGVLRVVNQHLCEGDHSQVLDWWSH